MFLDSEIVSKFMCGERKCNYLTTYGIAPYVENLFFQKVKSYDKYVILFDESLNHLLQTKQMDVLVRVWDANRVSTRFYTSKFLGHAFSETVQAEF